MIPRVIPESYLALFSGLVPFFTLLFSRFVSSPGNRMDDRQIQLTLTLLASRKEALRALGGPGDYSYEKIGRKVGVSGEAIRLLANRDMSEQARSERKMAQFRSASLLSEADEITAAGWIVCNDLLRLNTSVETFTDYLRTISFLFDSLEPPSYRFQRQTL